MKRRIVAHLDMDAFFASVEEREKPYLRGMPIVIGADPKGGAGRGVVSTANYRARKYGIGSAMPISRAWRLSEEARTRGEKACAFITPHHAKYSRASKEVFAIVSQYTPHIQETSVDEAYLDFSHLVSYRSSKKEARRLKRDIQKKTKLTCSVGIGPNKLIAKIASDRDKPDGLTVITPGGVARFLDPLPIGVIPGIGPKALLKFKQLGVTSIGDAKAISWEKYEQLFGKWGFSVYERIRGIDERPLGGEEERKSIGRHCTFDTDTRDMETVFGILRDECRRIMGDMKQRGFLGFRTTVLTVRFDDFSTKTRSLTVARVLTDVSELEAKAIKLALPFFDKRENPNGKSIRLVGLRVEKLAV